MAQAITISESAPDDGGEGDGAPLAYCMTLRPRRSVDPKVAFILLSALFAIWMSAGIFMTMIGAWPVLGFFGGEFIFIAFMMRMIHKRTEVVEVIEITPDTVNVTRRNMGLEQKVTFPAYWTQVHFDGSDTKNLPLEVRSHGEGIEVGAFLSANEKARITGELAGVLRRLKAGPSSKTSG